MILHVMEAEAEDYGTLTDICVKSKQHWGYPDYLIELWKDQLTITPRYIRNHRLFKIMDLDKNILGFGSIDKLNGHDVFEIGHFHVLPEFEDKNIPKLLLGQLEDKVGNRGTIKVVSDPHVMPFYQNCGYQKVGEVKSKPDGQNFPLLKKIIKRTVEV